MIDKEAVVFDLLAGSRRRVKIKKEKYGGAKSPRIMDTKKKRYRVKWKTEDMFLEDDYIVFIQRQVK